MVLESFLRDLDKIVVGAKMLNEAQIDFLNQFESGTRENKYLNDSDRFGCKGDSNDHINL